ncbi:MAG: N-acetyl-alpha-D-glucosaminyl L-malate synthase BshA [Acidobacteria bacterium]|nr:MAG: N-acetyl-alpha-D-glucosaminyl L-malate synthase BshA [Acidobacteriota bacterium]
MNIGITCYPTYGGSGVVATELGQELARNGHTVHFISSALPMRLMELGEKVFFHEVEVMNYPLFDYIPYDLALATKMVEVARLYKLDLLHVHYAIPHSISGYLAREIVRPTQRLPVVTTLHGTDITLVGRDHSFLPVTQFGIQQSDGVTAVSQFLKDATLSEFCGICDIRVIPNFVDTKKIRRFFSEEIRERFAPKDEKILVHLSNFRPVKRVADVIKIFHRVQKQVPAVLLMIGDGPERSNAQYLASQMGISNRVFFVGMLGMVESHLSVCDLMLLPSETESFGLAALEAMACEVPVVASQVGGLGELIEEGKSGCLRPVGDVEAMAAAALHILEKSNLPNFRKEARRRAVEHYSAASVIPRYEAYYREVIERTS